MEESALRNIAFTWMTWTVAIIPISSKHAAVAADLAQLLLLAKSLHVMKIEMAFDC